MREFVLSSSKLGNRRFASVAIITFVRITLKIVVLVTECKIDGEWALTTTNFSRRCKRTMLF